MSALGLSTFITSAARLFRAEDFCDAFVDDDAADADATDGDVEEDDDDDGAQFVPIRRRL